MPRVFRGSAAIVFQGDALRRPPRVGIVVSRFSKVEVDGRGIGRMLLDGCLKRLEESGLPSDAVTILWVPGAFEIPLAAKKLAPDSSVVITLGAVIRGDTPHFDFVAGEASRGIAAVALETGTPVIFGVLTTDDDRQALERCGGAHGHKGVEAAEAALEMLTLLNNYQNTPGERTDWKLAPAPNAKPT